MAQFSQPPVRYLGGHMDAKEAGQAMRRFRQRRGLTQEQVVEQSTVPTPQYLSALENGRHDIRNSDHFPSLAQVLGLSNDEIRELRPDLIWEDRPGPPIPPVVEPVELPLVIPDELQQVIDQYGANYPELRNTRTLRALTAIRREVGNGYGPQTAADWFEVFVANRRWFPK